MEWLGYLLFSILILGFVVVCYAGMRGPQSGFIRWSVVVYHGDQEFEDGLISSTERGFRLHSWRGVTLNNPPEIQYHVVYRHKTAKY